MEMFTQIFGGAIIFMIYSWRIITPYIFYRDVVSGSLTCDSIGYILTQGTISAGLTLYWILNIGFSSLTDWIIMLAFLSMAAFSFYFGIKAWWWNKNKKVEPEH